MCLDLLHYEFDSLCMPASDRSCSLVHSPLKNLVQQQQPGEGERSLLLHAQ